MQTIRELTTKWGFEVEHAPLEKVEKQLEGIKSRLELLAAAEIVKGIVEMTERFAHFAEELHVAAESAGVTVEAFQKLAFAAGQSNVSQDEMATSMARLSRMLYQARQGGEQAQLAFQKVGFTPNQVAGFRTGSDAMLALADRFKNIHDPIEKQALAMQLMGRGSINMVGFLSQGSAAIKGFGTEAEKVGAILSGEQVEALVKVEHSMNELWAVLKAVGSTIAAYFAPSIETAIKDFLKFYEVNRKLIDTNIRAWIWDITYALGFVYQAVKFVTQEFFNFAESHQTLVRRVGELLIALSIFVSMLWVLQKVINAVKGAVDLLTKAWEAFTTVLEFIGSPIGMILAAIGLMIVAVHDLWEVAHGRPGWINQLIEFLGIGQQVQDVFFAIFDIIQDIMNLDFGKLMTDAVGDVKSLGGFLSNVGGKALNFLGLGGQDSTASAAASLTAAQNLAQAPEINQTPQNGFAAGQQAAGQYNVTAPITINVPGGTDHKMVGDKVKEGISDHLDKVYRRAQQSLTPAQAY